VSLYQGTAEEGLEAIAPYLVPVDVALFDWILEALLPEPWGIFARSECDLATLQSHFCNLLTAESPDGERWYFRYYDPRVMERYLPTCTDAELVDLFGPVSELAIIDPCCEGLKVFRPNQGPTGAAQSRIRVRL
jgi:hypothetical protein